MPIVFWSLLYVAMPPVPASGVTRTGAMAPPVPPLGNGTVQAVVLVRAAPTPKPAGTFPVVAAEGTTLTIAPPETVTSNRGAVPPLAMVAQLAATVVVPLA